MGCYFGSASVAPGPPDIQKMEPVEVNGGTLSLQEVAAENIPTMLSQMRNHFPEAIHAHEYVRMLLRYRKMSPELEISILAPGGDHRLGIIFFLVDEKQLVGSIYCENEQARKAMEEALMSDKLNLPLKESVLLSGMNSNSHLAVKPYIDKNGWSELGGIMYWMPWYTARQLGVHLPEGVEIRKLTPDHADIINKVWPHKSPGSKEMIVKQITFNFGLGVFRGDDLLSWAIHFFYGGIGAVQTLESEKRKGYGKAVVEAITKKLGEMQNDVHLNVVEGNESGEAFFKVSGLCEFLEKSGIIYLKTNHPSGTFRFFHQVVGLQACFSLAMGWQQFNLTPDKSFLKYFYF